MRVFAALPLPTAQVSGLEELSTELCRRYRRLKPVSRQGFHITLLFWADLPGEQVRLLEDLLAEPHICSRSPMGAVWGKLGQFPPRGTPRVIFRHIEQGSTEIAAFQSLLTEGVRGLGAGFPLDRRQFRPHVTLARNRGEIMAPADWQDLAAPGEAFEIDRCVLYRSELMPQGPLYTPLKTIMFDGSA